MSDAFRQAAYAQRAAADPDAHVFVTANAGSGKTKVLVDRIARLLLTGSPPSSFLCITYTKAAAAEMQWRLFERLGDWCVMSDADLAQALTALIGEELKDPPLTRARALFARALETPGGLKIQTIHAFCERLLRRFPLEAGVAPGFEIAEDTLAGDMLERAWQAAASRGDSALDGAIEVLARRLNAEALAEVRMQLMSMRTHFGVHARDGVAAGVQAIVARHAETRSQETIWQAALESIDWGGVEDIARALHASSPNDVKKANHLSRALAQRGTAEAAFESLCGLYFNQDKTLAKNPSPTKAALKANPWLERAVSELGEKVVAAEFQLRAARRRDETTAAFLVGCAMLESYANEKAFSGRLDFEDLISAAHDLLVERDTAGWVLYKLDGGLDHILIDEGQDTNPQQWDVLRPLQSEFFAGAGRDRDAHAPLRTVFAVGDPKQSIYGFQGADPDKLLAEAQALETRARFAGQAFVAPSLAMSFRSTVEVLRAVDATLANADVGDGEPGIFDRLQHSAYRDREQGLVEWWPLQMPPEKSEPAPAWSAPVDQERSDSAHVLLCQTLATSVKAWIDGGEGIWEKGKLRPMRAGDVMALVRSRGPLFHQLLRAFKRAGLPVAGADRMIMGEELAVQDLMALARVALDPHDDLSLACVLKCPLVGLIDDDRDIFPLAFGREPGESLYDRLSAAPDRFSRARAFIDAQIQLAHSTPHWFFAAALEGVDDEGRSGWARMIARLGEAARDPLEEFMSRALNAGAMGARDLHAFLHRLERDGAEVKRQQDDEGDAIAVMTTHGAKGLERPVVLLPQTADAPKTAPDKPVLVSRETFVMLGKRETEDSVAAAARETYEKAALREHNRLLYVAMTRARDRLIVCGYGAANATSDEAHPSSWHAKVGAAMRDIGMPASTPTGAGYRLGERLFSAPSAVQSGQPSGPLPAWLANAIAPAGFDSKSAPPSGDGPGLSPRGPSRRRLARGRLIHGLLQRLPDVAPAARQEVGAAWLARAPDLGDHNAEAILAEALAVLDAPELQAVFGPASRAEAPVLAKIADGRRIFGIVDRLVVMPDRCIVLDYKTDRPPPAAIADAPERILRQMADYRAALRAVFPGRRVDVYLVWTLEARIAEVPGPLLDQYGS